MKITKFLVIFTLAFFVGATPILFIKYFSSAKIGSKIKTPEIKIAPPIFPVREFNLRTFNTEQFFQESDSENYNKRLLETGEISNVEDVKAKSGETWFGFFSENGKDVLRPTKLRITRSREHGLDWKKISVKEKYEPLFLLKKSNLKTGGVRTLFREKNWKESNDESSGDASIAKEFVKKFTLGDKEYTLRTEKGLNELGKPVLVLLLETGSSSQLIHYVTDSGEGETPIGNLYWVGDLDGDNKLDFYMDFWNYEKGYFSSGLFLSTEAKKGNLVGQIEYYALGAC